MSDPVAPNSLSPSLSKRDPRELRLGDTPKSSAKGLCPSVHPECVARTNCSTRSIPVRPHHSLGQYSHSATWRSSFEWLL